MTTQTFSSTELLASWSQNFMANYGQPAIALVRGQNATVWDVDGKSYIDFLAGIAVNSLGHAHPELVSAVSNQVANLGHTSNFAAHPQVIKLATRLVELTDPSAKVFFCNSGAEANEAAIKISRLTNRSNIVSLTGSFHGRTMGALSITGQSAKSAAFMPLLTNVTFIEPNDVDALIQAVTESTAALWLEPILGEGGVIGLTDEYLKVARDVCNQTGALLVIDEVQTGIARTGTMFAYQSAQITPDLLLLAKGLGGGLPIGAVIGFGPAGHLLTPGSHGSTFGGNPISCAAANAVLDVVKSDSLEARSMQIERQIRTVLASCTGVVEIRGRGAMLGVVLAGNHGPQVVESARISGLLINAPLTNVIRLVPPLTISDNELADGLEILRDTINQISEAK